MKNNSPEAAHGSPLGKDTFNFICNDTVPCFTRCCHDADMLLYPYDIIRLKHHLGMGSEEFLVTHTVTAFRDNPNFPSVMMKMTDKEGRPCPFLSENGCTVYENRPYSCRAYPLEPALHGTGDDGFEITAFLVRHDHCKGHGRGEAWTADQWMEDQGMAMYNKYNSAWARAASLLYSQAPPGVPGADNPTINMAYMASYNMDSFRRFVFDSSFLKRFKLPKKRIKTVKKDDTALMLLGFDWILNFIGGQGPLKTKK
ncbi:MAG: YkgJ family cysteine cluster protein [Desulfobacter sp.]|nr:MAG: YkgJ family cysteine cluster protein [Desulfobacter sp.]